MTQKLMIAALLGGFLTFGPILQAEETGGFVPYHGPQNAGDSTAASVPQATQLPVDQNVVENTADTVQAGNEDGRVVTGGFVPARDNGEIQQVQATAVRSGSSVDTINTMIGAKYVHIEKPQSIPQEDDQIWRVYDISPYTQGRGFNPDSKPEQTIVDWIIRQTGLKTWHGNPVGFLNATPDKLYVYHTLEIHREVAEIVDRFVNPEATSEGYTIRLLSVSKPDWMTRGHGYLKPIWIGTPGVQGWLISRDNYAQLLQLMSRRSDYTEHWPPQILIPNGCLHQDTKKRQRSYLRDVQPSTAAPGYITDNQTVEEGIHFSFVPLSRLDNVSADVMLKVDILQIEQMLSVTIEIPTQDNPRARHRVESPQMSMVKIDEMIHWPKDYILLLDLGTRPLPESENTTTGLAADLKKTFSGSATRANFLIFIERAQGAAIPTQGVQEAPPQGTAAAAGIPNVLTAPSAQAAQGQATGQTATGNTYWSQQR